MAPIPLPTLTEAIAIDALRAFFREKPFLFFGTGLSCAVDVRFGMPALRNVLLAEVGKCSLTASQQTEWSRVESALLAGSDLETALASPADEGLLRTVTEITGAFIAGLDREYSFKVANAEVAWPAGNFLKRLVDTLPEGDPALHAVTPNYDLLCEYSCDSLGIPYSDGFSGGVRRRRDWASVVRSLSVPSPVHRRGRSTQNFRLRKHLRLYKVHGSLNYFFHSNEVVQNDAWMWAPPSAARRVIITPGVAKYEALQRYRQELLQSADGAIAGATHFLFLGYGFNDSHLEEYIRRKLIAQGSHGVIVTRDSNPRIESLLSESGNLWLVCRAPGFDPEGTRVFNRNYRDWLYLPGKSFWRVPEFALHVLGG